MVISTRVSFTRVSAMVVVFTTTSSMADTKAIGSTEGTMGMGLRAGQREVGTEVSIEEDSGMGLGSIGFTPAILTPENGVMVSITASEFRLAPMGAGTSGSSSVGLSMASVATISEMVIDTQGSILETKFMDLVFTTLRTAIVTRDHGMKAGSRGMGCTPSEMGKSNVVNGIVVLSKALYPNSQIQSSEQFRQLEKQQRMQFI